MPRPTHRESTAAIIHVFSRGNYKAPIFATEGAKDAFLIALKQAINRCGWEVYAYAIMPNHFHLLLRTPRGNLSIGMQWLLSTFATRFNRYRKESGHVFQGRYRYVLAPTLKSAARMFDYVHLNHIRKGLCDLQTLEDSQDNSLYFLRRISERPPFSLELGLRQFTGYEDDAEGHRAYVRKLMRVLANDPDGTLSRAAMRDLSETPALAPAAPSPLEAGLTQAEIRAIDERHRDEFLQTTLRSAGKDQADIDADAKGAQWKAQIALRLSHHTTASTGWIADRLNMGTSGHVRKILSYSTGSDRF
jgi:REP element-mobilizing transposase RayT